MNWLSLNYRFKCGCLVGSTPTRCFPVSTGNLKFVFWIPSINSVNWHRKRLAIPPSWTVRLRHAVLCWHTAAHCRCSANTGWKVPGGHWVLTIVSQRKKGCESLTYPFPGFNFYICLSTTYTCQDNVSRLVLDSVEAWSRGLGRWFAKPVKSLKGLSQVRILLLPLPEMA